MRLTDKTEKKIDVINGLRGFAILAVIYHHTIFQPLSRLLNTDPLIAGNGWLGVNLFFILSGFVLYKPYFLKQRVFATRKDILLFYKHRFLRLYPLFFFVCIISVIFFARISPGSIRKLLETLSTLTMFDNKEFFPSLNTVYWSLILEIWFSIFFPLIIYGINKYGFNRFVLMVFIVSFLVRFAGSYVIIPVANKANPIKDCVIARIDDFILGMVICNLFFTKHKIFNLNSTLLFIVSIVFILSGCLVLDNMINFNGFKILMMAISNNIVQAGLFFLIIVSLKQDNWINRIFRMKILQVLGLMCFSLYSWHVLVFRVFDVWQAFTIVKLISYYFFTFVLAALTYRYVEFGSEKDWKKLFV